MYTNCIACFAMPWYISHYAWTPMEEQPYLRTFSANDASILITILHYRVDSAPVLDLLQQRTAYPLKYLSRNTCESKRNRKSLIVCITYQSRPENNVIHLNYFYTRAKEMHICSLCFQIFPKSLFISPNLASPPLSAYYLIAIRKLGGERNEERDISTAMSLTSG